MCMCVCWGEEHAGLQLGWVLLPCIASSFSNLVQDALFPRRVRAPGSRALEFGAWCCRRLHGESTTFYDSWATDWQSLLLASPMPAPVLFLLLPPGELWFLMVCACSPTREL